MRMGQGALPHGVCTLPEITHSLFGHDGVLMKRVRLAVRRECCQLLRVETYNLRTTVNIRTRGPQNTLRKRRRQPDDIQFEIIGCVQQFMVLSRRPPEQSVGANPKHPLADSKARTASRYQIQFWVSMKMSGPAGRGLVSPNLAARIANRWKGLMDDASHSSRLAEKWLVTASKTDSESPNGHYRLDTMITELRRPPHTRGKGLSGKRLCRNFAHEMRCFYQLRCHCADNRRRQPRLAPLIGEANDMVPIRPFLLSIVPCVATVWLSGCGGESPVSSGSGGAAANGGSQNRGSTATSVSSGGRLNASGANGASSGGSLAAGGYDTIAGAASTGGAAALGGNSAIGGTKAAGGAVTGGTTTGGTNATAGSKGTGGAATGGTNATGGVKATGGTAPGGTSATGGTTASGGTAPGGMSAAGGTEATGGAATGGTKATGGTGATGGSTSSANCSGAPLTGGTTYTSNSYGNVGNGYVYQYWSSGIGSATMTVFGVGAAFSASWNNVGDFLARVGLAWNSTQTYTQLGTVSADYAYTKTGNAGTFSFIGIYGWSVNPMHEYYIVDDWFGSGPPTGGGTLVGSLVVDGGTYDVYQHTQVNQPDVTGSSSTFVQFFSIRQTPRQCGHISISQHYAKWASLGLTLGNMVEAKLLVEVGGGTGSINFTAATVTAQ